MVLKEILVHMDTLSPAGERLDSALALAKRHGARITGINVVTHSLFDSNHGNGLHEVTRLQDIFLQKSSEAGIDAVWQSIDLKAIRSSAAEVISHHACFADLVVVGQSEHHSPGKGNEHDLPERVILGAGKPVLVVPYAGTFSSVGDKVLVAWKSGRESSRAITDALPLLRQAQKINLFEVNPTEREKDDVVSLCAHLERHDVHAKVETSVVTELTVGDVILNQLADEGSDLLVMGAYAHTHFGTSVLGDVARHVLRHMTVPVLMSH